MQPKPSITKIFLEQQFTHLSQLFKSINNYIVGTVIRRAKLIYIEPHGTIGIRGRNDDYRCRFSQVNPCNMRP